MKPDLRFDFLVDTDRHTITIRREFAASRRLVWACYTRSELLEQWFAPSPLTTRTSSMDFREGGHWHYVMVDPQGPEYWGRLDYLTIHPIDRFTALDGFSDATGALNPDLPRSNWDVTFSDAARRTLVQTIVTYASAEDLEKVIQMGVQAGMTSAFEGLDALLSTLDEETLER